MNQKFLSYAINLARKNIGLTAPNPSVGCVIVKDGMIIATGVTAKYGRPHAEVVAINKVKDKKILQGAEIYITLEPCCHFGQTPPCTDEIIRYKFAKAIISCADPNKLVNHGGIKKLQQAGLDVIFGVLSKEGQELNRAFFYAQNTKKPFVTIKLATSLDGKIATKKLDSQWITNEKSRHFSHYLRSINDAILVGANTVKKDDPLLTCRINGLEDFSPKRIIFSRDCNFDLDSKIIQTANKTKTYIISPQGSKIKDETLSKLKEKQIEILFCKEKSGLADLSDALEKICTIGINSVLIEGGQNLITQFLQENLVDEIIWIRGKKIIGNDGISAIGDLNISTIKQSIENFNLVDIKKIDDDVLEFLRKR